MHKLKIRQQFALVLLIILLTILCIGYAVSVLAGKIVLQKNIVYVGSMLEKIEQEANYVDDKGSAVINFLQNDGLLQDYFEGEMGGEYYELARQMDQLLTSIKIIYPETRMNIKRSVICLPFTPADPEKIMPIPSVPAWYPFGSGILTGTTNLRKWEPIMC